MWKFLKHRDIQNLQVISQPGGANYVYDEDGNMQIVQSQAPLVQPDGNSHSVILWTGDES